MTETCTVELEVQKHLVDRLDAAAAARDQSPSAIIQQAIKEWLAEEERRHQLTLEALRGCDEGRMISHEDVLLHAARLKEWRRASRA